MADVVAQSPAGASSESTSPELQAPVHEPDLDSGSDDEYSPGHGTQSDSSDSCEGVGHQPGLLSSRSHIELDDRATSVLPLQEGMLPRDLPHRTAYHDSIAERQMSQTDAKLFYQRSQLEQQKPEGFNADELETTPQGSPTMAASVGSQSLAGGMATRGPPVAPVTNPKSNVGASLNTVSLASDSFRLPPGAPISQIPARTDPVPRTATRPSLGDLGANPSAILGLEPPRPPSLGDSEQPNMGLPDGPTVGIGTAFTDNDPHITAELSTIFQNIQKILDIRHKYIRLSLQRDGDNPKDDPSWSIYPPPPEPAWTGSHPAPGTTANTSLSSLSNATDLPPRVLAQTRGDPSDTPEHQSEPIQPHKKRKAGQHIGEDFIMSDLFPLPGASDFTFRLDNDGVYQVFENSAAEKANTPVLNVPTIKDFYVDLDKILTTSSDGPSKSFAFRRLQYLEGKFNLYVLLNEYQETADSKKVPHRDFYNVRKVDTHVHHSACMNQKHLLRFIKSKMKKCPDELVLERDGKELTLAEVFDSINLTAYDLSIDTLDMHAHTDSFHRFDKFNLKYNPIGESRLRTIFLKTDNFIQGRYLAEITKEVISDLESSKYQMVEWRISIYGRSMDEWDKLAAWVVDNKLFSHNVRWLIQIPRLYDVYKATGQMESFEQVVKNVFRPLFEVTKDPRSHPKLHVLLQRVIGFDSVDDESKVERRLFKKFPVPNEWTSKQNPPYSYYIYYLFSNLTSLNFWRRERGFNTFLLRPHCGEAGDSEHLAVALLCSHSISHGLLLRKVPLLQYVFYLEQVGICMSPLSNNALFLAYERNPFHQYFKRGLNVSLSTDDPLQFAFTKEALIEEYAVAAQIYKLSPVDMCELARNSVKQSGYEYSIKQQWLGEKFNFPGREGNNMAKTNIPDRREEFRHLTWMEEHRMISKYRSAPTPQAREVHTALEHAGGGQSASPASMKANVVSTQNMQDANMPLRSKRDSRSSQSQMELNAGYGGLANQKDAGSSILSGSVCSSPLAAKREEPWATDSMRETHLSGDEPRYFPGLVARAQRRDSVRQPPTQETDDRDSVRSAPRRSDTNEGQSF